MIETTIFNPFLKKIVAKMIKRSVYKRFGCKCNIAFDQLDISSGDSATSINFNGKITVLNNDFDYLLKNIM